MKQQDKQALNSRESGIDDLPVNEDQAADVKGGPIYLKVDGVDGDVSNVGLEKGIALDGGPTGGRIK